MVEKDPRAIDLGDSKRKKIMRPGEVYLGNWPKLSKDPFVSMIQDCVPEGQFYFKRASQALRDFRSSGRYESVRTIPAYDRSGKKIGSSVGIVATQKSVQ